MSVKFEVFKNKDINPSEMQGLQEDVEYRAEEQRLRLKELVIEPDPRIKEWSKILHKKYLREWTDLGGEGVPDIPVYFIPASKSAEIRQIIGGNEITGARYSTSSDAVVVLVEEGEFSGLLVARFLAHELAHAYGKGISRYKAHRRADGYFNIEHVQAGLGMSLETKHGDFDAFFEEYYAVERELEALEELDRYFPDERRREKEILDYSMTWGSLSPEAVKYSFAVSEHAVHNNGYISLHRIGSYIMSEITSDSFDAWNELKKARVSMNWSAISRAVDNRFGKGTFKVIAHVNINPSDEHARTLLKRFLNETNEWERTKLSEEIMEGF